MLYRSEVRVRAAGKPTTVFFSVFILHTLSLNLIIAMSVAAAKTAPAGAVMAIRMCPVTRKR